MTEEKNFKVYNPGIAAQMAPLAYIMLLEEARERAERAEEFVRRYPYGCDVKIPDALISQKSLYDKAFWEKARLDKIRALGYAKLAAIREMLEPDVEPVLVSIGERDNE